MTSERNICVVLLEGLGDVIQGLPVVNALKRADPSRRITWVVEPMPAPILSHHPAVDRVVVFHKGDGARGVARLASDLRRDPFDLAINLNVHFRSLFPLVLSGAPVRLGFDRRRSHDMVWLAANRRLPPGPPRHTQDLFLGFLALLDVPAGPLEWRLAPTVDEREDQRNFFRQFDRPVAAIVPASGNPKKDWLADRYAAVVNGLDREFGYAPVLVGGPSERERRLAAEIVAGSDRPPAVALGDGVRRLLWLLDGAALVIAPDTGPVHIARAVETPVIGLYGPTSPWRVGPYRRYEDLWVDAHSDPGDEGEEGDAAMAEVRPGRMDRITAAQVLDRVQRAVERYPPDPPAPPGGLDDRADLP